MENYWDQRSKQVTLERLLLAAGVGVADMAQGREPDMEFSADPADPDEGEFLDRKYYVTAPHLSHGPTDPVSGGALVTGVGTRKYRIVLELVDEHDGPES